MPTNKKFEKTESRDSIASSANNDNPSLSVSVFVRAAYISAQVLVGRRFGKSVY